MHYPLDWTPRITISLLSALALAGCGGGGSGSASGTDGTPGDPGTDEPGSGVRVESFPFDAGFEGSSPTDIAVADLDGDGFKDVVMSREFTVDGVPTTPVASVFYQDTAGAFSTSTTYTIGSNDFLDAVGPVAVGDVDGDGIEELGVAYSGTLVLLDIASDRSGSGLNTLSGITDDLRLFRLEDYTGDDNADVILVDRLVTQGGLDFNVVRLQPLDTDTNLVSGEAQNLGVPVDAATPTITDVAVTDESGDGRPDLVVSYDDQGFTAAPSVAESFVTVFRQSMDGSFELKDINGDGVRDANDTLGPFPITGDDSGSASPDNVVLERADIDGDGMAETVHLVGTRIVDVEASEETPIGNAPSPTADDIALADFDGDQLTDLAAAVSGGDRLVLRFGQSDGGLGEPQSLNVGPEPIVVEAADLGNDGRSELIVLNRETPEGSESGQITVVSNLDAL